MQLKLRNNLLYVSVDIIYKGKSINTADVIVDTGSATTVLSADLLSQIDITPSPNDILYTIRGIGGTEVVFSRHVALQVGKQTLSDFEVEISRMDYGFPITGILGLDFLLQTHAIIDLDSMKLFFQ